MQMCERRFIDHLHTFSQLRILSLHFLDLRDVPRIRKLLLRFKIACPGLQRVIFESCHQIRIWEYLMEEGQWVVARAAEPLDICWFP
jgi:hypothetical protein